MADEVCVSSVADRIADRVIARLRGQVAEQDRRIEDLRVALIRAINTTLSRAGVEVPAAAAATVDPSFTMWPEALLADARSGRDRLRGGAAAPVESPRSTSSESEAEKAEVNVVKLLREIRYLTHECDELRRGASNLIAERDRLGEENAGYRRQWNGLDVEREKWAALARENEGLRRQLVRDRLREKSASYHRQWAAHAHENEDLYRQLAEARAAVKALEAWRDDLKRQLAEATEWRPMTTAPAGGGEQVLVRCEWDGYVSHDVTVGPHTYTGAVGWLPIPPYRAKKEGQ